MSITIESLKPLLVRFPDRDVSLRPGHLVEFPEADARRLLEKIPDKVKQVPAVGQVIRTMEKLYHPPTQTMGLEAAGRIDECPRLAVVLDRQRVPKGDQLAPGIWCWLGGAGQFRWQHESCFVDLAPRCPHCGGRTWWWSEDRPHCQLILCATCHPPLPDWQQQWRSLATVTTGITKDDPRLGLVLAALAECDHAFAADNYPGFLRAATRVRWVALRPA